MDSLSVKSELVRLIRTLANAVCSSGHRSLGPGRISDRLLTSGAILHRAVHWPLASGFGRPPFKDSMRLSKGNLGQFSFSFTAANYIGKS